jgi:D-aspartate ligase
MTDTDKNVTPVMILEGHENALSIVRSLGQRGIPVSVSASEMCPASKSRFCKGAYVVPEAADYSEYWSELLLSGKNKHLRGSVLLAGGDNAIQFLAANRKALQEYYILDINKPDLQSALLDKKRTLELAQSVGVPVPNFWNISGFENFDKITKVVQFPVIIKPILSHVFQRKNQGRKFLFAYNKQELEQGLAKVFRQGSEVMISEFVPGPDSLLSSYYTYMDKDGRALFHFTKKVVRRFPVNEGGATYHITEWLPKTAELGKKFFEGVGLTGLGNIEFKYDTRDGELKVIESNARFTAAQELLVRSGLDTAYIIYCHLTGRPVPVINSYKENVRLLFLREDFAAYRQLRSRGELSIWGWLKSIAYKQTFPYFRLTDPVPAIFFSYKRAINKLKKKLLSN